MKKFVISDEDNELIEHWVVDHECSLQSHGAIGGRISYEFTPTGLGVVTQAKCACGMEFDVTDYSKW